MEFFNPLALRAEGENHRMPPRATFSQPHTLAQLDSSPILLRNTEEQKILIYSIGEVNVSGQNVKNRVIIGNYLIRSQLLL